MVKSPYTGSSNQGLRCSSCIHLLYGVLLTWRVKYRTSRWRNLTSTNWRIVWKEHCNSCTAVITWRGLYIHCYCGIHSNKLNNQLEPFGGGIKHLIFDGFYSRIHSFMHSCKILDWKSMQMYDYFRIISGQYWEDFLNSKMDRHLTDKTTERY